MDSIRAYVARGCYAVAKAGCHATIGKKGSLVRYLPHFFQNLVEFGYLDEKFKPTFSIGLRRGNVCKALLDRLCYFTVGILLIRSPRPETGDCLRSVPK